MQPIPNRPPIGPKCLGACVAALLPAVLPAVLPAALPAALHAGLLLLRYQMRVFTDPLTPKRILFLHENEHPSNIAGTRSLGQAVIGSIEDVGTQDTKAIHLPGCS
jgi:hypothetical protein